MCLGVPGKVLEIFQQDDLPMAKVEFGGIVKETCLAYTPEAEVGDYVLVHVGFALSRIDESEAREIFDYLDQIQAAGLPEELAGVDPLGDEAGGNSPDDGEGP